ncbi:MAG: DUF1501 domain-containing protein [Planctomycetota bacterium]|nr:DUF1501 domain-containing protein [Planctomycetota bacterium]
MAFSQIGWSVINRRVCLKVGALSILGKPDLASGSTIRPESPRQCPTSSNSCIFILLQGGPSQLDLWDPKPQASAEVRGPFQTVGTRCAGVRLGELMKETSSITGELAILRGVHHNFNNHIAGTYITLTGSDNQPNMDREADADDFPGPGAILNLFETRTPRVPRSISLPNWLSIPGPSNRMPGQYSGFLGSVHDPFLIKGDPNSANYNPLSLDLAGGMTAERFHRRLSLREQLDSSARLIEKNMRDRQDGLLQSAYDLVTDGRIRKALQLTTEKNATREAYGRNRFGQSLLMARRLVEAGVQFVSYNAFNQQWDTHGNLQNRYLQLVPTMDRGFAALVADLKERGMQEKTLVINTGEFGRTPVINKTAGRDHWPNAYSLAIAGGQVRGGIVHGRTDNKGAEVIENGVTPADVLATMWRHLGVDPQTEIRDRLKRPFPVSTGRVLHEIF